MKTKHVQRRGFLTLLFFVLVLAVSGAGIGMAAAEPVMSIIPSTQNVDVCDNFSVFIEVNPAGDTLQMARTDLTFDPSKVTILEVVNSGNFDVMFHGGTIGDSTIANILGLSAGVSSTVNLTEIRMHADSPGTFTIGLSDARVGNATDAMTPDVNTGTVTISGVPTKPVMSIVPATQNVDVCDNFSVFIEVNPAGDTLQMARTDLTFDPSKVTILEVVNSGNFDVMFHGGTIGDSTIANILGLSAGVSSTVNLTEIRMHADNPGTFTIGLSNARVGNATDALTPDVNNGTVTINVSLVDEVVINEFVSTTSDEWIELYNLKDDVSLDGWTIEDGTGSPKSLTGEEVLANDYLVLYKSEGDFGFALNDPGDIIILKNGTREVDRVAYGNWDDGNTADNAPAPDEGNSTGRDPNGVDTDVDIDDFTEFGTPTPDRNNTQERMCGDVAPHPDGNGIVDMGDVVRLLNHVSRPGDFPVDSWAGDCKCTDAIDMGDVILLLNYVSDPDGFPLECCD